MLALQGNQLKTVPVAEVAGNKRLVPIDHPLLEAGRMVGTSFGD